MTNELTIPDGWIEREPERFEDRLFVTKETGGGILGIAAKGHVAYYSDGVIEVFEDGEYTFHDSSDVSLQSVLNNLTL
jgi:hypothetical protein